MADKKLGVMEGVAKRFKDMGDGTFAEVISLGDSTAMPTARGVFTRNGTSVAGAMEVIPADANRTGLTIRNDSDVKMYFRTDGEAGDGVGYPMDAGRGYSFEAMGMLPSSAVSVWCGTAGKKWAALYSTASEPYDA